MNQNLRTIVIPDCMFFIQESQEKNKESYLKVAQVFSLNVIEYEEKTFRYSCNEVGLSCNLIAYEEKGMGIPICCRESLGFEPGFIKANLVDLGHIVNIIWMDPLPYFPQFYFQSQTILFLSQHLTQLIMSILFQNHIFLNFLCRKICEFRND